jgi:flagellar basal body-associated protein FliL
MVPFALAGGSWIFLIFLIVFLAAVVFGYFTRTGSGIDQTPYGDLNASSGPERPSELAHDRSENPETWSRGTR